MKRWLALFGALAITGCGGGDAQPDTYPDPQHQPTETAPPVELSAMTQSASGLNMLDLVVGEGEEAVAGRPVTVYYTGWFLDGEKFDSSLDRGKPYSFPLGAGLVIPGWDEGVAGMRVGGWRRLVIPPGLAYGEAGSPPVIPPNSTLVFDVELLDVK